MRALALVVAGLLLATTAGLAAADDDGPHFTFGASTSYTYDIGEPDPGANNFIYYGALEPGSSESFNIDLVQIGVNGQRDGLAYSAKLDFGDLAVLAENTLGVGGDGDVGIQEAYVAYSFDPIIVTAGRFPTPIGYEVLEPWGNAHISRSRAWSLQPISHDGLTVSTQTGGIDVTVGVANSFYITDDAVNDLDDGKSVLASIGGAAGDVDLSVAGIYGKDVDQGFGHKLDLWLANGIASTSIGDVGVAIEGNYREDNPEGGNPDAQTWNVTAYVGVDIGPTTFDVRGDYGDYELAIPGGDLGDIWSVTTTLGIPLSDGVAFRVEYIHVQSPDTDLFDFDASDFSSDDTADILQAQVVWNPEF